MSNPVKDYLSTELARNKANAALYSRMIQLAYGKDDEIMIAHHLTFERDHELSTMNEIPSADTLIFDHDAMGRIFGIAAPEIMANLALVPVEGGARDKLLAEYVSKREAAAMGAFKGSARIDMAA